MSTLVEPRSEVTVELERLTGRRRKLAAHLDQVEADARQSVAGLQAAREALGHLEAEAAAGTVSAKQRAEVERALDKAEARRAEPWPERLDGARAALRDAEQDITTYAADHVDELIAHAEAAAEPHVHRVNQFAAELDAAIIECSQAANAIAQTLGLAGIRPNPHAVTMLATDRLRAALDESTGTGGQPPIVLDRRRVPALAEADRPTGDDTGPVLPVREQATAA